MPLLNESTSPLKINYNGLSVKKVNFNGVDVWHEPSGETISLLGAGVYVRVLETAGYKNYRIVDKDYYGHVLLVRDDPAFKCIYDYNESFANSCRYNGSVLDENCINHYSSLPIATKSAIKKVSIPVRESAQLNNQQYLERYCFALSAKEWGFEGSNCEGVPVEITSARKKTYSHWTREVVGGMASYAYVVNYNDSRANNEFNGTHYVHPAICVAQNQPISVNVGNTVEYTLSV